MYDTLIDFEAHTEMKGVVMRPPVIKRRALS